MRAEVKHKLLGLSPLIAHWTKRQSWVMKSMQKTVGCFSDGGGGEVNALVVLVELEMLAWNSVRAWYRN